MKLSIVDRIIIDQSILPEAGTIEAIKTIISIRKKLAFNQAEMMGLSISKPYGNIVQIDKVTPEMVVRETDYPLAENEIIFLKNMSKNCNENGWVTMDSLDTIEMILNYNEQ